MRIVRTKSIPNVDDDRLIADLGRIHDAFHTTDGLREHDGPRRDLVNNGIKGKRIAAELQRRGHAAPSCPFCRARP
jgi:hypothetical protein